MARKKGNSLGTLQTKNFSDSLNAVLHPDDSIDSFDEAAAQADKDHREGMLDDDLKMEKRYNNVIMAGAEDSHRDFDE